MMQFPRASAKPKAAILIRNDPHYRRDAFEAGLRACGYDIIPGNPTMLPDCDVLVTWGLGSGLHLTAQFHRNRGGKVIVAENGYIGADENGHQLYALARDGHNDSGTFPVADDDRWSRLGIELKPWRTSGDTIVVFGQRGIGPPSMRSPPNWHHNVARKLRSLSKQMVLVSDHPGHPACSAKVYPHTCEQLRGAHAAVVWSSARGLRALVEGVPVIYQAPHWIGATAASSDLNDIEKPPMPDREAMFKRLAHAQWTLSEISAGEPFRRLLA